MSPKGFGFSGVRGFQSVKAPKKIASSRSKKGSTRVRVHPCSFQLYHDQEEAENSSWSENSFRLCRCFRASD
jgi:hypothetical protein